MFTLAFAPAVVKSAPVLGFMQPATPVAFDAFADRLAWIADGGDPDTYTAGWQGTFGPVVTSADLAADACHAALCNAQDDRDLDAESWSASLAAEAEDDYWMMDDAHADRFADEARGREMVESGCYAW